MTTSEPQTLARLIQASLDSGNVHGLVMWLRERGDHADPDPGEAARALSELRDADDRRAHAARAMLVAVRGRWAGLALDGDDPALARAAAAHPAFERDAEVTLFDLGPAMLGAVRTVRGADVSRPAERFRARAVCLINVRRSSAIVSVDWREWLGTRNAIHNLLTKTRFNVHGPSISLAGHQALFASA